MDINRLPMPSNVIRSSKVSLNVFTIGLDDQPVLFVGEGFGSLGVFLAVDGDPDVEGTRGGSLIEEKFGGRVVDGEVGEMDDAVESDAELALRAAKGPTVTFGDIRDKGGDWWSTDLSPALAVAE